MKCRKCNKTKKILTKESLCAFCFKEEKGFWSEEFQKSKKEREKSKFIGKKK